MAVRVVLELTSAEGRAVETSAVLNGGFEVQEPHLLLPLACARRLWDDPTRDAPRQEMEAAGASVEFYLLPRSLHGRVLFPGGAGPRVSFRVLVSETDAEVLVSDTGIDALGVRIESFAPGRWRLGNGAGIHETAAPQYW